MKRLNLSQELQLEKSRSNTRRHFMRDCGLGLGAIALGGLTGCFSESTASETAKTAAKLTAQSFKHFAPKAKSVIYLHMAGAPSQLELFDYKPELAKLNNQLCPPSFLEGKRFAFIEGIPKMLGPQAEFKQYGENGTWVSEHLPYFAENVDKVTLLKAVHTDQFNHAPAQLFLYTGSAQLGRPSMGSWVSYGLGSMNEDLPAYVVLVSGGNTPSAGKNVWGSGFLPSVYQGVQCRSQGDPILYLTDPEGVPRHLRKQTIEAINEINEAQYAEVKDPEILTRMSQYELAYRMQMSVPEVMDINKEPEYVHEMYGTEPGKTSFANNCLLARKLVENNVRFVQLFDWGWDMHGTAATGSVSHEKGLTNKCNQIDKPIAALLTDLEQRGLLEETLVVWGGEFGRTPMQENRSGITNKFLGRDHHPSAFTMWMAGGGIKSGFTYGETDELGYYGIKDQAHIHDIQATILHQLGMDHERLTYHFQGRDYRLTDVAGHVIKDIVA